MAIKLMYIPHGIPTKFYRIREENELEELKKFRENIFKQYPKTEFVVMYNSRNIRRKQTPNILFAFQEFLKTVPKQDREKCTLLMHTQVVDDNGTDLGAVHRDCTPEVQVIWSPTHVSLEHMNKLYNCATVTINMSDSEGYGLGTAESLMAETMIIATVTGGLQDQMGFRDENDNLLHEDVHFTYEWGTNAEGTYTTCGDWCLPLFPVSSPIQGSPPTPYIGFSIVRYFDAAKLIRQVYDMTPEERARRGGLGRQYLTEQGHTVDEMSRRMILGIDTVLNNFQARLPFELIKV